MSSSKIVLLITIAFLLSSHLFAQDVCNDIASYHDQILEQVRKNNPNAISDLPECFRADHTLILKSVVIDPSQFENASDSLREDQVFVTRLIKISPEVLKFAAPELRSDPGFMRKATYLSRDALQYAKWNLLDNRLFMKEMIRIDSRNYKFASDRIKEIPEFAEMAFKDDGLMLEFATNKIKSDKRLVKIAVTSNASAIAFASDALKKDKELAKVAAIRTSIKSAEDLSKFLKENYVVDNQKKNLGKSLGNQAKFFSGNQLINRNYVTKWQRNLDFSYIENGRVGEDTRLISANSRNYQISWYKDFKKYPELIKKIEKFLLNHNLATNTIENLSTTYLWKIKSKPLTLAFNLYLLRDSTEIDLGPEFSNVTLLTAIAQQNGRRWEMTVIQVIFDSEVKVDIAYEDGHKKYTVWDLYKVDKKDKNPKIIFKVSDRFGEHFEIFEEQNGGKYQMVYTQSDLKL